MTAPDKPLHERIAEYLALEAPTPMEAFTLLREAAEALREAEIDSIYEWFKVLQSAEVEGLSHETGWTLMATTTAETRLAELSRMRTALEEIRAKRGQALQASAAMSYQAGSGDAFNQCAAIAECALTAGSGNE